MDMMQTVVFVGSFFIVIYIFIIQPNQIKGVSMEPTFYNGNYILTSKVTYKIRKPILGDVVVFHSPRNPDIEYIKRVIGLPGDTVLIQDQEVYVNGDKLDEPYISAKTTILSLGFAQEGVSFTVPEDHLFVMGDNRPRSSDSREFGPIEMSSIVGQVVYRYFPLNLMGTVKNPHKAFLQNSINLKNYPKFAFNPTL